VKYPCLVGRNHIALPMDQGYTTAGNFGDANTGMMDAISYWDAAAQTWMAAIDLGYWEGDFAVQPGSVLMVNALSPFDAYSIGALPSAPASYSMIVGLNDIMVPLNRSDILTAGGIGDEITGSLDALSYWDAIAQTWMAAIDFGYWEGDFPVIIGFPMQVNALIPVIWPTRAATSTFGTRNK